jgi:hypothetical protein
VEVAELKYFLPHYVSYRTHSQRDHPKTKVAILDTGVNNTRFSGKGHGVFGRSFVNIPAAQRERESPWWCATDPHGSHVANIISKIDPTCDFYICKIADDKYHLDIPRVVAVSSNAFNFYPAILYMKYL